MKLLYKTIKYLLVLFLGLAILGAGGVLAVYLHLEPDLPSIETLKDIRLQEPLRVYSSEGKLIAEYGEKRREPLKFNEIPEQFIQAFLAAEDDRFFEHPGVDYQGLIRAATQLLLTGERRQGGSTITMQVARNFFLSRKKTYTRKLNEIFLALKIERLLTKQEILELYLNKIYLGHRAYGIGAASKVYYGRPVRKLELSEIAMIAGLPKAPSRYNPITNPDRAVIRRNYVLGRMFDLNLITKDQYDTATDAGVSASLQQAPNELEAPYLAEMARALAVNLFTDEAYTSGYSIYTTLDSRFQEAANRAVRKSLHAYDKRHGYRGVEGHIPVEDLENPDLLIQHLREMPAIADLSNAVVIDIDEKSADVLKVDGTSLTLEWNGLSWASNFVDQDHLGSKPKVTSDILKQGDMIRIYHDTSDEGEPYWRLAQIPRVSGALISISPDNGSIKALVGGYDYYYSKFNRVTQAKRQPGSGFKAFIYSAALAQGYTAATLINDAPVVFDDPGLESTWRPENYSGKFFGPTRLRYALSQSRNLVSIRLLRKMGIANTLEYISRFGFSQDELPRDLSLALGSGAVTPLQMAEGYAVLANGGYHVRPYFIEFIEDDQQNIVFQSSPTQVCHTDDSISEKTVFRVEETHDEDQATINCAPRVITAQNHYLMNSMMRDVIQHGTAKLAKSLNRSDLAGKTGTTNDQRDAWFNGFNQHLVTVTWVGFDDASPLGRGEVGGRTALPAWIDFMRVALDGTKEILPEQPPGMITMRIDVNTGKPVSTGDQNAIFEVFRESHAPKPTTSSSHSFGKKTPALLVEPEEDPF
ncbi:MAG: penicillin-binding protein 1A [Gammaproteobacteria bacterium]|nr:penicillin-binding protein 1A [Gammaproteobacteria bacterium]